MQGTGIERWIERLSFREMDREVYREKESERKRSGKRKKGIERQRELEREKRNIK